MHGDTDGQDLPSAIVTLSQSQAPVVQAGLSSCLLGSMVRNHFLSSSCSSWTQWAQFVELGEAMTQQ
jgi:hypothetical protein